MGNFRFDNKPRFGDRSSRDRPRNNRFGGGSRGGFGRDRDSRTSERRPREMHDVVCDKCGKQCQVPFRPSSGKPVLCSDCFSKNKSPTSSFSSRNQDNFSQSSKSGASSEQMNQINAKLDKILLVLQDLELEVEDDDFEDSEDEDDDEDDDEEDEEDSEEDSEDSEKDNSK